MSHLNLLWHLIKQGKEGKNKGLSTGLPKLDSIIGGLQQSRYYCISGATSSGKTALVLYMIYRILKDYPDEPVNFVYFSLEIGSEILLSKLMGLYLAEEQGRILTINDILSLDKIISDADLELLAKAKKWLEKIENKLYIFDKGLSARILYKDLIPLLESWGKMIDVDGKTRYIKDNPKQRVFVITDHISLARPEEGRTLKAEIDLISAYYVTLKRRFYISPIVLMQQNRDSSSMDRRKADMSEPGINDTKDGPRIKVYVFFGN